MEDSKIEHIGSHVKKSLKFIAVKKYVVFLHQNVSKLITQQYGIWNVQ
jgi:hypothetical protein